MRQIYISKAHGFILVYSISDKNSYEEMKKLWEQIKVVRKNILNIPVVVIALQNARLANMSTSQKSYLEWSARHDIYRNIPWMMFVNISICI
jgi:GTPase SAR1 family protein